MILLINLKTKKTFTYLVFKKDSKLIEILINVIKISKNYKSSNKISKVFCNLFLDEYKEIYFNSNDPVLEELFITNNEKFSKINIEGLDKYPKPVYKNILENIINLDITYSKIFSKNVFEDSDKPIGNLL